MIKRVALAATAVLSLFVAGASWGFGFDDVAAQARERAAVPYRSPAKADPRLLALKYDAWRDIRFAPARSVWRGTDSPFEAQLFHAGGYFPHPVEVHEIVDGQARPLALPRDAFVYGRAFGGKAPMPPEIAGFRLHYPFKSRDYKDEVVAFLGASYFRAVTPETGYGLSARGLAIDPVGGKGEEFPAFRRFWLERPAADATSVTVYALLDSPRASGAYRIIVRPGTGSAQTVVEVQSRLYLRAGVATLALAPLTSMFLSGENQPRPGDFRPEVHDSDGLSVASADGEWLWRPLANPRQAFTTSFALKGLKGFGLMQRDRAFASYEDTEARYDRRPSAWVEPVGDWGPGRVELMQFGTSDEFTDNVVAYWVPAKAPAPGQALDLAWRIHWQGEAQQRPPGAWVAQTRRGHGPPPYDKNEVQYVVDFTGGALTKLDDEAPVSAVVNAVAGGEVRHVNVYRHPVNGAWRMTVGVHRTDSSRAVELRGYLKLGTDVLTETWSHVMAPE